jgi:hypothetical protein
MNTKSIDAAIFVGMSCGMVAAWDVMSQDVWMSFTEINKAIFEKHGCPMTFWFNTLAAMEKRGVVERCCGTKRGEVDLWRLL